jgi:hypothetical protein
MGSIGTRVVEAYGEYYPMLRWNPDMHSLVEMSFDVDDFWLEFFLH